MKSIPKLILASQSIGRRTLLTQLGEPFEIIVSEVDEDAITHSSPTETLKQRARAKADKIVKQLAVSSSQLSTKTSKSSKLQAKSYLVIAADSSAIIGKEIFGKVKNRAEAETMVRALMGKTHDFITATSIRLINKSKEVKRWDDITTSYVSLRNMSDTEIKQYLERYEFTKFAACYTLNETPWDWMSKLEGSYTNVIGLPFEVLLPILREVKIL